MCGCGRRMAREPERFEHARADHGRTIADHEDAVERTGGTRAEDGVHRRVGIVESNRHGGVAPRIVERAAAIGGVHEIDTKPLGGVDLGEGIGEGLRRTLAR